MDFYERGLSNGLDRLITTICWKSIDLRNKANKTKDQFGLNN